MNQKRIAAVALVVVGILAVILSFVAFGLDTGYNVSNEYYGGDAYTGIQQAAAQTARNLVTLTEAVAFVGGAILLIGGLALIAGGIANWSADEYVPNTYEQPSAPGEYQPPKTHESAVGKWTCTCGRVNPDYQSVCSCGVTKQETRQAPKLMEKPVAVPVRTANGWRCSCGKEHPNFVSNCECGVSKSEIR